MAEAEYEWKPGSFTKNFSWGDKRNGLLALYETIRIGFNNSLEDVPREEFVARVSHLGRPDKIPTNFFLFNKRSKGVDYLVADELVFHAVTSPHSARFDKLALFAFNLSLVGRWSRAKLEQRRPALWANRYIIERVAKVMEWDTSKVNANDIERFVTSDKRYKAQTARKLATNLNYLYTVGHLSEFSERRVERWWVDALFLVLDRVIEDSQQVNVDLPRSKIEDALTRFDFEPLAGRSSLEKELASKHIISLYIACGGRDRFSDEHVQERTSLLLPDVERFIANDPTPQGAVHPTNPRIIKIIPRACAMLAKYVGFELVDLEQVEAFDTEDFIRNQTQNALNVLRASKVLPTMSAEDLMKLTRK